MRALPIAFLSVVLLACGQQKVKLSPLVSWAATLAYMGEQWIDNRIPASLLRNSIAATQKEIEKARKATGVTAAMRAQLDALDASAGTIDKAVESGDKQTVNREAANCQRIHEALDALEKATE